MPFEPINPPDLPASDACRSAATKAGDAIYVSSVDAAGRDGAMRGPGNIRLQTKYALESIAAVLEAAGATMADVAVTHVLLRYRGDLAAFDEVYGDIFPDAKPARRLQIAEPLAPDALVEIGCVAHVGD